MFNRLTAAVAGLCVLASVSVAKATDFDFKDPKGVSTVTASVDSLVEPFSAYGNGLSGTVSFDPAKPEATSGAIVLAVESLRVAHPTMTEHMHGEKWLDKEKYPAITFTIKSVEKVEAVSDTRWKLTVAGELTLHGVTKPITTVIDASFVEKGMATRMKGDNDLLVLRSSFTIDRVDYGISPGMNTDKIGNMINLSIAIVGTSK